MHSQDNRQQWTALTVFLWFQIKYIWIYKKKQLLTRKRVLCVYFLLGLSTLFLYLLIVAASALWSDTSGLDQLEDQSPQAKEWERHPNFLREWMVESMSSLTQPPLLALRWRNHPMNIQPTHQLPLCVASFSKVVVKSWIKYLEEKFSIIYCSFGYVMPFSS